MNLSGKTNLMVISTLHIVNEILCGVLISFSGKKTFTVKKCLCDENDRILILETLFDDSEFILLQCKCRE